ncbi:MAG TPA: glycosyltransferase family 9 protein [Candidatus Avacidaminococcus intestinavium]|uniref:Glycosyltransferase family 9 protein n=1 Tax=Candidatus Avacidaminococcus intestinavium TaxID=2840684 RepID=A0A9D1MNY1_9FIRM|nr:glycosyltransferase family 9 protein [Candidatus Avacidaminococcus intestinavium]
MEDFLVICTSYFGDTILTGALCQNIKLQYPDSHITYIANKPFYEAAAYLEGVDEVWSYDKKGENKGLAGFVRFVKKYRKQKNFTAAFVIYGNERGILLAKSLGVSKIYGENKGLFRYLLANKKYISDQYLHKQDKHALLLEYFSEKKTLSVPIIYQPPNEALKDIEKLFDSYNIATDDCVISICTTTKSVERDLKMDTCCEIIKELSKKNIKIILIGAGASAATYSQKLKEHGCNEYIDLINKTSIAQLGAVLKRSNVVISVDTGTLHLAIAVGVPVVAVFYICNELKLSQWAPKEFYEHRLVADGSWKAKTIIGFTEELLEVQESKK